MSIDCRKLDANGLKIGGYSIDVPFEYCPPAYLLLISDIEFQSLPNYQDYSGSQTCLETLSGYKWDISFTQNYPCGNGFQLVQPVEFFTHFNVKPAYVEHPSFSNFQEVFVMSQEQIDLFVLNFDTIAFFFVAFTLMAAFIKGFNTGMNS